ncbi:DUF368 domain-containing protein [Halalkalirubrum salinum]|uniref:DUF368 domain-containing protein n=1 Tax=Halalkalirubrum salinum TaxID=2563889 RepID=UPI0010FB1263|nr:DUF368 domain-containing protein [Halalkalirubrum salinum]
MTSARELLGIYLRGLCMGTADAVPGVSGGTIALITGIYERLITAITAISPSRILRLLGGVHPSGRKSAKAAAVELDLAFLLALGTGIATAIVAVLSLVSTLIEVAPVATFGFFFGLIAASAIVLYGDVELNTHGRIAAAIAGFVLAFVASGVTANAIDPSATVVFVAGAIAVSAMILPGISGSLLLLLLGQYAYMSNSLSAFVDGAIETLRTGNPQSLFAATPPVITFILGAIVGVFTIAYAVRYALEHYREATIAFLVSLIVGALRAPIEQVDGRLLAAGEAWTLTAVGLFAGFGILGAIVVLALDRVAEIEV